MDMLSELGVGMAQRVQGSVVGLDKRRSAVQDPRAEGLGEQEGRTSWC